MTIQQAFEKFILSRKLADLSKKTVSNYMCFVQPFVSYITPDSFINELTDDTINGYIETLIDKELSKSTRVTYIRHLKVFLQWVQDRYLVAYDAKNIRVPKSPKKNVKIYSPEEVQQIFDAVTAESEWIVLRNCCIVALMYDSGLRLHEVSTLKRADVSLSGSRLTVTGKGSKQRTVPLGGFAASYLKQYWEVCPYKSKYVFVCRYGEPLTDNAVRQFMQKLADELPFELSAHRLRHNFATNYCLDQYEKNGQIDVFRLMILMGHEDLETTKRYLHLAYEIIGACNAVSHLDKIKEVEN